ncbi:MAG: sigma 54-interacting transcriptional regulator [Spirochaetales bacterium]|nr:sigma 54-interacting transcriptional regulator [Spirochaetales bacterium]
MSDNHSSDELVRRYRAVHYLFSSMNSVKDPNELFQLVLSHCVAQTSSDYGAILLWDGDETLETRLVHPAHPKSEATEKPRIRVGEGLAGRTFLDGVPRSLDNTAHDPEYIPIAGSYSSILVLPFGAPGKVRGVIRLESSKTGNYSEHDSQILLPVTALAGQLLSQIEIKTSLEWTIRQKDILIDISRNVAKHFDLNEVFGTVMHRLAESFNIMRGMLVLLDSDNPNALSVRAAYNLTDEEMSRGIYTVGEGVIGKVVESGEAISIRDIYTDKNFLNRMKVKRRKDVPISFIAVPFRVDGQVAGVIAVEKAFESDDVLKDEKDLMILVSTLLITKIKVFQSVTGEHERLIEENSTLKQELKKRYEDSSIICKNRKMLELLDLVHLVADSNSSVMILGESGTGKELIAREVHRESNRSEGPFISINCAAIPDSLLESELFGYKKGAFTGATQDKRGKFQMANGGTLFLDEIGDMPMQLQAKLLRAIQEREIEPVGSERKEKIDIRIVAATNRDLPKLIKEGKFREDLYYRLNVVELQMPPLRDRADDIPFLTTYFLEKFAKANGRSIEGINPTALRVLQNYRWPGNVRELENIIERAVLVCRGNQIEASHLPLTLSEGQDGCADNQFISRWITNFFRKLPTNGGFVWDEVIGTVEKELIQQSLLRNNRNKVRTALFLGINRNTLHAKMDRYGID